MRKIISAFLLLGIASQTHAMEGSSISSISKCPRIDELINMYTYNLFSVEQNQQGRRTCRLAHTLKTHTGDTWTITWGPRARKIACAWYKNFVTQNNPTYEIKASENYKNYPSCTYVVKFPRSVNQS